MSVENMQELLIDELKDLYSAEKQIVKALPKLAKAVTDDSLREALESHLEETKGHVTRIEQVGKILETKLEGKTCAGMKGVLEEGPEMIEEVEEGALLDAGLISAAQRVEHYEMAGYGSARDFAKILGLSDVADLLEETLEEEKEADKKLTTLSRKINVTANEAAAA